VFLYKSYLLLSYEFVILYSKVITTLIQMQSQDSSEKWGEEGPISLTHNTKINYG
jgi:hypothetical protein